MKTAPKTSRNRRSAPPRPSGEGLSAAELKQLERLGREAETAVARDDDAAVFGALGTALEMAAAALGRRGTKGRSVLDVFQKRTGFQLGDAVHEFVTTCLNTERFAAALRLLERLTAAGWEGDTFALADRAELLTRLGRGEEAERLLLVALDSLAGRGSGEIAKIYLALGDVHYHWQDVEERRDLKLAEAWFYRAFDEGLAKGGDDTSRDVLEHLGDICLDRLRAESEDRLLVLLKEEGLGWRTLAGLREAVWQDGAASPFLRRLARQIESEGVSSASKENRLRILFSAYEHMPQDGLEGYSAFERAELMPPGRHESRIMHELANAYMSHSGEACLDAGLLLAEDLPRFQQDFLNQLDPMTGRRRGTVVAEERGEMRRRHEEGAQPWLGFVRYRK